MERIITIQLTDDNEFDEETKKLYDQLDDITRRKMMFQAPLPSQQYDMMPQSKSNSSSTTTDIDSIWYSLNGVKVRINTVHYFNSLKFQINLTPEEHIDRDQFLSEYVTPQLIKAFQTLPNEKELERLFQSMSEEEIEAEFRLEIALETNLYSPLRRLIKKDLEDNKDVLTEHTLDFLISKGAFTLESGPSPSLTLKSIFRGGGTMGTQSMGIRAEPDLVIGYTLAFEKPPTAKVVMLTGLGEVKLPTMDLNPSSYSGLATNEFTRTIKKLTTVATHCGVRKFLLTNYNQMLVVELDENFEGSREFGSDVTIVKSRHHYFESTESFVRLFIFSFFSINKTEVAKLQLFRENVQLTLDIAIQYLLRKQRLKNIGILRGDSASSSQSSASRDREQQYSPTTLSTNFSTSAGTNQSLSGPSSRWSSRPSTNSRYTTRKLLIDLLLFTDLQPVDMGNCIVKLLQSGKFFQSQVMTVQSHLLMAQISTGNKFCFSDNFLPDISLVKIFDPFIQCKKSDEIGEYRKATYYDSMDSATNELAIYVQLEELQGDLVPEVFAYGNLQDVHKSFLYSYKNFQGPFILMQSFDSIKDERVTAADITFEIIFNYIVPQFKRLHQLNVLHNDFKFDNIIVTRSKAIKIIDFSKSKISYSPLDFRCEIENIYRYFGYDPVY